MRTLLCLGLPVFPSETSASLSDGTVWLTAVSGSPAPPVMGVRVLPCLIPRDPKAQEVTQAAGNLC